MAVQLSQQLVDAYNEKFGPRDGVMDKDLQEVMFDHKHVIEAGPRIDDTTNDFISRLHKSFSKVNDFLMNKYFNSAHSFTEGMDPFTNASKGEEGARIAKEQTERINSDFQKIMDAGPDLDSQIEWITGQLRTKELGHAQDFFIAIKDNLLSIKQWKLYHSKVDVEKVIEDLVKLLHHMSVPSSNHVLQNAEASLGLLQAFKQEQGLHHETTRRVGKASRQNFNELMDKVDKNIDREIEVIKSLDAVFEHRQSIRIINAIDAMLKLKGIGS